MEILMPIIVIIVLIAAYVATQNYFKNVETKFSVTIRKDWKRFIPAIAMVVAIVLSANENNPISIVIILAGMLIYGFLMYKQIGDMKHTILVTILMSIVSFVYVIVFIIAIFAKNHDRDQVE